MEMSEARTGSGALAAKFARLGNKALDLVYPQNLYCLCCEDTMEQSRIHGICDRCAEKINWLDHDPFRAALDEFAFDKVMSCCVYGFYPRKIMYGLKLHNKTYIAKNIGLLMAEKVKLEAGCSGGLSDSSYTALVPVPSSPKKLKTRGYNQAELLAERISKELGLPLWKDALLKTRETASLRMSTGQERRSILEGAFAVPESACEKVRGADILLVDDVVTTGSTADACAIALRDAGAKSVTVLCFASTARAFSEYEAEQDDQSCQGPAN